MKVGIVSDTHDRLESVERAVSAFKKAGVGAVLHCGDFCSPFVARKMAALEGTPFHAVRGNNDGDISFLNTTFAKLGPVKEPYQEIVLEGRRILLLHGHAVPEACITDIAAGGRYDVVVYGHYHHVRNEVVGKTLVLNPGEACGYLGGTGTAMIVDLGPGGAARVEVIEV
ncbi:MAG: metallophosphoesterase [Candidatus Lokiarchaeota archaeon]|nr:metallophosphoesterase [Candidatus Lokiarchaeota archaeon]